MSIVKHRESANWSQQLGSLAVFADHLPAFFWTPSLTIQVLLVQYRLNVRFCEIKLRVVCSSWIIFSTKHFCRSERLSDASFHRSLCSGMVRPDLSVMAASASFPRSNGASTLDAAFSIPVLS